MPRIGGQEFGWEEVRAFFAANNPPAKPIEQYTPRHILRIASAQIRGAAVGQTVTRQQARRGAAPEHPGRPRRIAPDTPRFIRQVQETLGGRFRAAAQRTGRQVGDALREFVRAGVERVRIEGTFIKPDGSPHHFVIGRKGGYTTRYLARLIGEQGSWQAAIDYLLTQSYGTDYGTLDMGSINLVS